MDSRKGGTKAGPTRTGRLNWTGEADDQEAEAVREEKMTTQSVEARAREIIAGTSAEHEADEDSIVQRIAAALTAYAAQARKEAFEEAAKIVDAKAATFPSNDFYPTNRSDIEGIAENIRDAARKPAKKIEGGR